PDTPLTESPSRMLNGVELFTLIVILPPAPVPAPSAERLPKMPSLPFDTVKLSCAPLPFVPSGPAAKNAIFTDMSVPAVRLMGPPSPAEDPTSPPVADKMNWFGSPPIARLDCVARRVIEPPFPVPAPFADRDTLRPPVTAMDCATSETEPP